MLMYAYISIDIMQEGLPPQRMYLACRRQGRLLLATTHAPEIARTSPGVTATELERLERTGFLFRPSVGPFNEQSAFHSPAYLQTIWSRQLDLRGFFPRALGSFQDISAWEKPAPRE